MTTAAAPPRYSEFALALAVEIERRLKSRQNGWFIWERHGKWFIRQTLDIEMIDLTDRFVLYCNSTGTTNE